MFCTLAWLLACKFRQISDQVNDSKCGHQLRAISDRHLLVCQAVDQLDKYFRNILLIVTCCIFIGAINDSFSCYWQFGQANYEMALIFAFETVLDFLLLERICNAAERLKDEVGAFE